MVTDGEYLLQVKDLIKIFIKENAVKFIKGGLNFEMLTNVF